MRLFPSFKAGQSCLGHINHFYRFDDRNDELSRSNDSIIESTSSMTLNCTENLQSVSRVVSEPESFTTQDTRYIIITETISNYISLGLI